MQGIVSVSHDVVNNWFVSGAFDGSVRVCVDSMLLCLMPVSSHPDLLLSVNNIAETPRSRTSVRRDTSQRHTTFC